MKKIVCILIICLAANFKIYADPSPVEWNYRIKMLSEKEAVISIEAKILPGWFIYSCKMDDVDPIKTTLDFEPREDYELIGKVTASKEETRYYEGFKSNISYYKDYAIFEQKVKLKSRLPITIKCKLSYSPCNDSLCLMPAQKELVILLDRK